VTVIDVPDMGRILVRQGGLVEETGGVFRRYHRVGFNYLNGGIEWYSIGSATFKFGADYRFSLYGTVCAALSFYVADKADGAEEWDELTDIPVGYADMTRHAYRVVGDGRESWSTGDKNTSKTVRVTRRHDEPIGEAVSRCLAAWPGWEDAGTFDSLSTTQVFDETSARWYTVPVEGQETDRGIPCVQHSVRFRGEMTAWVPTLADEWTEGGKAWR